MAAAPSNEDDTRMSVMLTSEDGSRARAFVRSSACTVESVRTSWAEACEVDADRVLVLHRGRVLADSVTLGDLEPTASGLVELAVEKKVHILVGRPGAAESTRRRLLVGLSQTPEDLCADVRRALGTKDGSEVHLRTAVQELQPGRSLRDSGVLPGSLLIPRQDQSMASILLSNLVLLVPIVLLPFAYSFYDRQKVRSICSSFFEDRNENYSPFRCSRACQRRERKEQRCDMTCIAQRSKCYNSCRSRGRELCTCKSKEITCHVGCAKDGWNRICCVDQCTSALQEPLIDCHISCTNSDLFCENRCGSTPRICAACRRTNGYRSTKCKAPCASVSCYRRCVARRRINVRKCLDGCFYRVIRPCTNRCRAALS